MKSITKTIAALAFILLMTNAAFAQENKTKNFKSIDLKELKKVFVDQLLADGLIEKKKEDVHLAFRSETTLLNDEELDEDFHKKYGDLAAKFNIDRGSYRIVYITRQCIAVGDFYKNSFSGRMQGKMDMDELTISIR